MELNMEEKLEQFIPLVQLVVAQMKKTLSNQVDESELYSSGMTGLWDASQKFDPSQGVKFETYAVQRIRGAILDGIRQTDHVSRTLRKKEKTFREARETLEQFYLRKPTPKEMTEHLGINPEEYERTLMQLSFIKQESLDEPLDNEGKERAVFNRIEDYYFPRQEEYVEAKEKKKRLAGLIDTLPEREKLILALVYYENLSLTDVSKILELHKSRISQLHNQAIKRLRTAATEQGWER